MPLEAAFFYWYGKLMAKKTFYITTPLYYVNAKLHLGHAYTTILADVIARYQRQQGKDVFFLTGTDEHGATNVRAAEAADVPIETFVDQNAEAAKELFASLSISNDDFIRTSDQKKHWPGAQMLWKKLQEKGVIYKGFYSGLYCVGHEAFITEKDLVDGKCADHGKAPEMIKEENYLFRLSAYAKDIKLRIKNKARLSDGQELRIIPETREHEVLRFLEEEGLKDVSFSRPSKDISWGIPVPGDASQTMYVWCDALTNYISALGYGRGEELMRYWPANLHVMGKDILRFHALIWPGMLLAAGLPLPEALLVHGHITSGGRKMSKTLGNVIDPYAMIKQFGSDAFRFLLMKFVNPFADSDITAEGLLHGYNGDLANGVGNLVSRIAGMAEQFFGGHIVSSGLAPPFVERFEKYLTLQDVRVERKTPLVVLREEVSWRYQHAMEEYRVSGALELLWGFYRMLDGYIQHYEPFKLMKTDREKTASILYELGGALQESAKMITPFMPKTAGELEMIFQKKGEELLVVQKEKKPLFGRL